MAVEVLETVGMKCPQPVLKLAVMAIHMNSGDILEVVGDCPTFERDLRTWCERLGKTLLSVVNESEGRKRVRILF